ncbi:lysM and putative peptidoglycan-binding domain-containing protein 3 [Nematostella vectensis]|uniref:lysM and putative peptidoglycan-binding domain-containing protein 3 n=1 Tax=Nematostella vectensis TaxID=45351 RepID=UPI002076F6FD|nr:lysM and putative peptidoglycan-binding domain-containing protein 3 [Nematostella vectensis]
MNRRGNYTKYSALKFENESFGEVQNKAVSRVYVFGNDSSEELSLDDQAVEMSEIRTRGGKKESKPYSGQDLKKSFLLEREIHENDTLQSFALNFGCTMEEIKRANNLYSEQDFHALQMIKIPVQPHGLLAEQEKENKEKGKKTKQKPQPLDLEATTTANDNNAEFDDNDSLVRTVSIRSALNSPYSFLKNMDEDLKNICKGSSLRKANLDQVARTLTVNCIHPIRLQTEKRDLGNVWGIGWKWFVVLLVLVCIVIPAFIAAYWLWPHKKR